MVIIYRCVRTVNALKLFLKILYTLKKLNLRVVRNAKIFHLLNTKKIRDKTDNFLTDWLNAKKVRYQELNQIVMLDVITEVKLETHVANCTSCDLFQLKRLIWLRIEKQEEPPKRMRTRSRLRCACCAKRTRITNRAKRTSDHAADKCARKWWIGDGGTETERECEEWKKRRERVWVAARPK